MAQEDDEVSVTERAQPSGDARSRRQLLDEPCYVRMENAYLQKLFVGSLLAADRAAAITRLVQSAKLNCLDAYRYLKDVFRRLPTHWADSSMNHCHITARPPLAHDGIPAVRLGSTARLRLPCAYEVSTLDAEGTHKTDCTLAIAKESEPVTFQSARGDLTGSIPG